MDEFNVQFNSPYHLRNRHDEWFFPLSATRFNDDFFFGWILLNNVNEKLSKSSYTVTNDDEFS